jgi:hypothetical protein
MHVQPPREARGQEIFVRTLRVTWTTHPLRAQEMLRKLEQRACARQADCPTGRLGGLSRGWLTTRRAVIVRAPHGRAPRAGARSRSLTRWCPDAIASWLRSAASFCPSPAPTTTEPVSRGRLPRIQPRLSLDRPAQILAHSGSQDGANSGSEPNPRARPLILKAGGPETVPRVRIPPLRSESRGLERNLGAWLALACERACVESG